MSDPSLQPKSEDRRLSIAADFVRVLWSPTAVFRRRRATRARRVLFVLWLIITLVAIPVMLLMAVIRRPENDGWPLILYVIPLATPVLVLLFVLATVGIDAIAVRLATGFLGLPLSMNRAFVIAALSSSIMLLFVGASTIAFFALGQPAEPPPWINAITPSLGPLAPESRPLLGLLLSSFGLPFFWLAAVHAIGAREIGGGARPVKFTAPVFWAALVAVMLVVAAIFYPIGRWAESAGRAADREAAAADSARAREIAESIERARANAADTTRAPARAP
jgi:hypothetical protein